MMCVAVFYTAYMRMPVIIYAHACHYICARLSLYMRTPVIESLQRFYGLLLHQKVPVMLKEKVRAYG